MKQSTYKEEKSWIFLVIMAFITLFLVITPFYKGLFNGYVYIFEGPIYSSIMGSAIALFFLALYIYRYWRPSSHRDLLSLLIWLIPISYLISTVNAASIHLAMNDVYIKVLWAILFMIGLYYASSTLGSKVIQYALIGSGYILVIFGFMNWFGNVKYKDAIMDDYRLAGVFQYPNTYAAYLIAILVITLILINVAKKWYFQLIPSLMLLPIMLSLLLTLSRGAFLIVPIILLLYFLLIPWYKQILCLFYLGLTGVASLLVFSKIKAIGIKYYHVDSSSGGSIEGWLILLTLSMLVCGAIILVHGYCGRYLNKGSNHKVGLRWSNGFIPLLMVVGILGSYLLITYNTSVINRLPDDIKIRIEGINSDNSSVVLRNTFYKDALTISNDYPYFGAGGGAWSTMYNSYKTYPYLSSQAHNFYVQYLVEVGWIGVSILIVLLLYISAIFMKYIIVNRKKDMDESKLIFPVVSLVFLVHSLVDFDMSFVYVSAIVFLSLGATISHLSSPIEWLKKLNENPIQRYIGKSFSVILLILSITLLVVMLRAQQADSQFKSARSIMANTQNYNEFVLPLNKSIELRSGHPEYNVYNTSVLLQLYKSTNDSKYLQEANDLIQKIISKEPNSDNLMSLKFNVHIERQELELALNVLKSQIQHNPWNMEFYERTIDLYVFLGDQADKKLEFEKRDKYWDEALLLFDRINERINTINTLPASVQTLSKGNFKLTEKIVSQIELINATKKQLK